jgi:hypothetical protein
VRKSILLSVAISVFSMSMIVWGAAQQARTVSNSPTSIDEVLLAVREDLQNDRADIMAKNLSLTSEQAARFWPTFASYQKEQSAIIDEQLKGIQQYIENYDTLDDTGAVSLLNAHLDRDARMVALRQKWLGEFQNVLGPKLAVRAIQIDRRLSLVQQLQITTKIPLVH